MNSALFNWRDLTLEECLSLQNWTDLNKFEKAFNVKTNKTIENNILRIKQFVENTEDYSDKIENIFKDYSLNLLPPISENSKYFAKGIFENNNLIGVCALCNGKIYDYKEHKDVETLQCSYVVVRPDLQKLGYGKKILLDLKLNSNAILNLPNINKITAYVEKNNIASNRTFKDLNFNNIKYNNSNFLEYSFNLNNLNLNWKDIGLKEILEMNEWSNINYSNRATSKKNKRIAENNIKNIMDLYNCNCNLGRTLIKDKKLKNQNAIFKGVYNGNKLLGVAVLNLNKTTINNKETFVSYLSNLIVNPLYWNNGIAVQMLNDISNNIELVLNCNKTDIKVVCNKFNNPKINSILKNLNYEKQNYNNCCKTENLYILK